MISASVYTLVCISFERHRAIIGGHCRRMSYQKLVVTIIIIWTFSLAIFVPTLLEYSVTVVHVTDGNTTQTHLSCGSQTSRDFSLTNAIFVFIVSYAIPVILMLKNHMQVAVFGEKADGSGTIRVSQETHWTVSIYSNIESNLSKCSCWLPLYSRCHGFRSLLCSFMR